MLTILAYVLSALLFLALVAIAVAASRPSDFHYSREVTIARTAASIYPHVADFKAWEQWSPYQHLDPNATHIYSAQTSGEGATHEWNGNNKVGAGKMRIDLLVVPTSIEIDLTFLRPFQAQHRAMFTFVARGETTVVTWSMTGKNPLASRVFGLFVNLENLVCRDFERGLGSLKALVEAV
jgi:hypothetical protein